MDASRFTKVAGLDKSIAKNRKVCYLLSQSEAVRSALKMCTFTGRTARYIETVLFEAFEPDDWIHIKSKGDWVHESDLINVPLKFAIRDHPSREKILGKFRLNPNVRAALGAFQCVGESAWWINRELLAEFDHRYWPYHGEMKLAIWGVTPGEPGPRTFDMRVTEGKQPGSLTCREAAWLIGRPKSKLQRWLYDSDFRQSVGAVKNESGFWIFDEEKLKAYFELR